MFPPPPLQKRTGNKAGEKLYERGNPLGFPEVERRGTSPTAILKSTTCHWRLHCSVRPAVSLITDTAEEDQSGIGPDNVVPGKHLAPAPKMRL